MRSKIFILICILLFSNTSIRILEGGQGKHDCGAKVRVVLNKKLKKKLNKARNNHRFLTAEESGSCSVAARLITVYLVGIAAGVTYYLFTYDSIINSIS